MSMFLRKFSLGQGNYLNMGLCGKDVEIRITCFGKTTLNITYAELQILHNSKTTLIQEGVTLSTSFNQFGDQVVRRCGPPLTYNLFTDTVDRASGPDASSLCFTREIMTPAQPLSPLDNVSTEFKLDPVSAQTFLNAIPNLVTVADKILRFEPALTLGYKVIGYQIKRLTAASGDSSTSYEHFLYIMRILEQYIPITFLVSEFKRNCTEEPQLNVADLFKNLLFQYTYIYDNIFNASTE